MYLEIISDSDQHTLREQYLQKFPIGPKIGN